MCIYSLNKLELIVVAVLDVGRYKSLNKGNLVPLCDIILFYANT